MKVNINGEYHYVSFSSDGWKRQNSLFRFITISNKKIFVKVVKKNNTISFLKSIVNKKITGIPLLYDVIEVNKNNQKLIYLFYESLENADVLSKHMKKGLTLNWSIFFSDIGNALKTIWRNGLWMNDFGPQNIIFNKGHYYLIDIDSCKPHCLLPKKVDITEGQSYYWKLFNNLNLKEKNDDWLGAKFNFLQLIYFAFHVEIFGSMDNLKWDELFSKNMVINYFFNKKNNLNNVDYNHDMAIEIFRSKKNAPLFGLVDVIAKTIISKSMGRNIREEFYFSSIKKKKVKIAKNNSPTIEVYCEGYRGKRKIKSKKQNMIFRVSLTNDNIFYLKYEDADRYFFQMVEKNPCTFSIPLEFCKCNSYKIIFSSKNLEIEDVKENEYKEFIVSFTE